MKKLLTLFLLITSFLTMSCGGGGDSGDDDVINTPPTSPTVDPPSQAALNRPVNNEICEEGTSVSETQSSVNFQWTAGSNTDSYDLRITNLNTNQTINQTNISQTNKTVTLNKGTPYSWKVISKRNGTNQTSDSSTWKFYLSGDGISNYPPYPSLLVSPTSGYTFSSETSEVELQWEGSHPEDLAMNYDLYIDNVDGLQEPSSSNQGLTSLSKTIEVSSGNNYFWRVKATDSNGNSSYSIIYSFRVD